MKNLLLTLFISSLLVSCSTSTKVPTLKSETYKSVYKEKPKTILVLLPINKTNNVEAKEFFYTTLCSELCDRGYYVLPPFMGQEILRRESANDSEQLVGFNLKLFGEVFGADAVLFTTINTWQKDAVFNKIKIGVDYTLKSTRTNEVLMERSGDIIYDATIKTNNSSLAGILIQAVASKINTAATSHVSIARKCNYYTFSDIPSGFYHQSYLADSSFVAGPKSFKYTVN